MSSVKGGVESEDLETKALSMNGHFVAVTDIETAFIASGKTVHSSPLLLAM